MDNFGKGAVADDKAGLQILAEDSQRGLSHCRTGKQHIKGSEGHSEIRTRF